MLELIFAIVILLLMSYLVRRAGRDVRRKSAVKNDPPKGAIAVAAWYRARRRREREGSAVILK